MFMQTKIYDIDKIKYIYLLKGISPILFTLLTILLYLCKKILSRYFRISFGVVRSLPRGPRCLAVRIAANAGGRGSKSHRGQEFVFHILL